MKKATRIVLFLAIVIATVSMTGCIGVKYANNNDFGQTTVAPFNQNNFHVVKRVTGESTTRRIFGIGGLRNEYLKNSAITKMYDNANLTGSQTIVDVRVIVSRRTIVAPVYVEEIVVAKGTVIEFDGPAVDMNPQSVKIIK